MAGQREILMVGEGGREWQQFRQQVSRVGGSPIALADAAEVKQWLSGRQAGMVVLSAEGMDDPLDLVRELVFLFRGIPVLVATVGGSVSEAKSAIAQGAADYLVLPEADERVEGLVRRYSSQYFDPELGRGRRLLTADPAMLKLLNQVRRVAGSTATILIQGESGTGKELIARYIHQSSERNREAFVAVNCAALPENLLESELFGHAKGAFTGALNEHKGKFQQANGGTILLDEISEMSLNLQAKLLRVLQEGEVDPVGGRGPVALDVRVIASTNRELRQWVSEGKFREDLYYRLNVFPVHLPPLRQRVPDILLLADHFRKRYLRELGRGELEFALSARQALQAYGWPGNVRELENAVQRALLVAEGTAITAEDMMLQVPAAASRAAAASAPADDDAIRLPVGTTVREMEEILIRRTLDEVAGNRTRAAELLGISIRTLRNKLNEYESRA